MRRDEGAIGEVELKLIELKLDVVTHTLTRRFLTRESVEPTNARNVSPVAIYRVRVDFILSHYFLFSVLYTLFLFLD